MLIELPFVSILWDDAWIDTEEFVTIPSVHIKHKPMPVETRGWLLIDDDKGVSVANERCLEDEGSYRGRTFIPRAMITSMEVLKTVKPRKPRKPPHTEPT